MSVAVAAPFATHARMHFLTNCSKTSYIELCQYQSRCGCMPIAFAFACSYRSEATVQGLMIKWRRSLCLCVLLQPYKEAHSEPGGRGGCGAFWFYIKRASPRRDHLRKADLVAPRFCHLKRWCALSSLFATQSVHAHVDGRFRFCHWHCNWSLLILQLEERILGTNWAWCMCWHGRCNPPRMEIINKMFRRRFAPLRHF